jgi:hypothetical protein
LTSIGDTLSKPSYFENTFFDSFAPADTVFGKSLFADHSDMFFEALASGDSTERYQALRSLDQFEFKDKDADDLMELLDDFEFDADEFQYRLSLIKSLGTLKNDDIIDFLDEYFNRATDTLQVQLAVLSTLSELKSKESCAKFLELLDRDTPLASDYSDIRKIFLSFEDSLETAANLFPELLDYLQYPEYKYSVTRLAAKILEKGVPGKDILNGHKKIIIREARNDLKRRLSSEKKDTNGGSDYSNNTNYNQVFLKKEHNRYLQLNFAIMLMQWSDEPAVEKYLEKLLKSSNNEMRILTIYLYLKNDIDFDQDVINEIAERRQDRRLLYVYLNQADKTDLMDDEYKSRQAFAEAQIYPVAYNEEKDSLVYLEEKLIAVKGHKGWLRFYKRYRKNDETTDNYLVCTGLFPEEKDSVSVNNILTYRSISLDKEEKDLDEEIEKMLKRIRIYKRQRAFIKKSSGYYN